MKKQNKKHESGRSMIEMVGVLAVMGLITAAAFVLITSAMRSQKLSRADDDISALAAGVRLPAQPRAVGRLHRHRQGPGRRRHQGADRHPRRPRRGHVLHGQRAGVAVRGHGVQRLRPQGRRGHQG